MEDTSESMYADVEKIHEVMRILKGRFRTGKHDETAQQLRRAAQELISRARHPSRNPAFPPVPTGNSDTGNEGYRLGGDNVPHS